MSGINEFFLDYNCDSHNSQMMKVACIFPNQSLPHAEMHIDLHVNCHLLLSDFNQNLNVSTAFSGSSRVSNLMKICSTVCKLSHIDRQMDRHCEANKHILAACSCIHAEKNTYTYPSQQEM